MLYIHIHVYTYTCICTHIYICIHISLLGTVPSRYRYIKQYIHIGRVGRTRCAVSTCLCFCVDRFGAQEREWRCNIVCVASRRKHCMCCTTHNVAPRVAQTSVAGDRGLQLQVIEVLNAATQSAIACVVQDKSLGRILSAYLVFRAPARAVEESKGEPIHVVLSLSLHKSCRLVLPSHLCSD